MTRRPTFHAAARGAAIVLPLAALFGCAGPGPDSGTDAQAQATAGEMPVVVAQAASGQPAPEEAPTEGAGTGAATADDPAPVAQEAPAEADVAEAPEAETTPPEQRVFYFDTDHSAVQAPDMALIEAHAAYLAAHPEASIRIEGHSDRRGTAEHNRTLSEQRAREVARLLMEHGASKDQIEIAALGEDAPVGEPDDLQANRRVELNYARAYAAGPLIGRK